MALVAGIGSPKFVGKIGPGDPDAMVPAGIHNHIGTLVHMAFETACSLFGRIVKMVFAASIFGGHMATVTECVSIHINLAAVGFVAVLADHAGLVHFALQKGSINIDLFQDLTISIVKTLLQ